MTPESIVTSLEWSKKLMQSGYPQDESLFCWGQYPDKEPTCGSRTFVVGNVGMFWHAAPTAEEILRRLPPSVMVDGEMLHLDIMDDRDWIEDTSWDLGYSAHEMLGKPLHVRSKDSFADACAKMYCLLAEQKLL